MLLNNKMKYIFICLLLMMSGLVPGTPFPFNCMAAEPGGSLADMSLEALMDIEITSVSKKVQKMSETAAAVFVITSEDIARSGVTNIADALSMAPGVHAARIESNKWAVSIRGFNGRFANKLLVLIDGRSVYTPLYSGVFWEVQDMVLADIDRIEVIRGPGAAVWGSNAVNGVINIITKNTRENRGGLVEVNAGNIDNMAAVRYEKQLNDHTAYRIYAKYKDIDNQVYLDTDEEAEDRWNMVRTGFKVNHDPKDDTKFNLQGEYFDSNMGETLMLSEISYAGPPYADISFPSYKTKMRGGHVMFKWQKLLSASSDMHLQLYYDRFEFNPIFIDITVDLTDLTFQHRFAATQNQEIVWGLGYRYTSDDLVSFQLAELAKPSDTYGLFSMFLQDEISLFEDRVKCSIGSHIEKNDFTGWEFQPNAKILWAIDDMRSLWASFSRAVRTPSRAEAGGARIGYAVPNMVAPTMAFAVMEPDFDSESLIAYEVGYRSQVVDNFSIDAAAFLHVLDDLRGSVPGTPYFDMGLGYVVAPVYVGNCLESRVYGFELAADWNPKEKARIQMAYTYLNMDIKYKDPALTSTAIDGGPENEEGKNPKHQLSMQVWIDIMKSLQCNIRGRYVSKLQTFDIDDYYQVDLGFTYQVTPNLDIRVVGQNLLHNHHPEYISEYLTTQTTENMRKGYVGMTYRF